MRFFQLSILILVVLISTTSISQDLFKPKFGLRAGANFSTMFGPSEADVTEDYRLGVRIVAGGTIKYPLHEIFGLTAEVMFIQKGAYYSAEASNSFIKLPAFGTEQEIVYGYTKANNIYTKKTDINYKKKIGLNVINGYIEIPVMLYVEPVDDKLQIDLGLSMGFLISSQALGTVKFGDADILDASVPDVSQFIEMDLDFKYINDEIGALYDASSKSAKIDGTTRYYPRGPSAYYLTDLNSKDNENFYSLYDFGLQAGISYYFSPGLKLGLRANYSLLDITTDKYDYSKKDITETGDYIIRNDKDFNFGVQLFVGLQF